MISIITATYNRANSLERLYRSLIDQTYKNFEWIIIDDGSNDTTKEIINKFIIENKINIIYEYQQNSGKHKALNKAIKMASGELIFFVDSDDYLTSNSIEFVTLKWEEVKDDKSYAGISGSCISTEGEIIGDFGQNKHDSIDANSFEFRYKFKVKGDKAEVFRKEVIEKYKFPDFEGERFIPEATVFNRIANDGYRLRWYREPIYICEYRKDGLTAQGRNLFISSWNGYSLYLKEMLTYNEVPMSLKIKLLVSYIMLAFKYKKSLFTIINIAKKINSKSI